MSEIPTIPLRDSDKYLLSLAIKYDVSVSRVKEMRSKWVEDCYLDGHPKENWISFNEWLML